MEVRKGALLAHGRLCGGLWLSYDFPVSLEQGIDETEPYTGTSEAELNSGSALICFMTLAKFLLPGAPPVFLVRWGAEPVDLGDCPSSMC